MRRLKLFNKKEIVYLILLLGISIVVVISNYIRIPLRTLDDAFAYITHGCFVVSGLFGILYLLSINRFIFFLLFPAVFSASVLSAYVLYFYNITVTGGIVDVMFNTDWKLSLEFVSIEMIIGVIIILAILSLFLLYRLKRKELFRNKCAVHVFLSIIIMIPSIVVNELRANTIINRSPFTIIAACDEYIKLTELNAQPRFDVGEDAISINNDSLLCVVIIGEAVRNDHLGFNGYSRNTTPLLSSHDIIAFPKTKSLSSYTAASVPQLLTRADSVSLSLAFKEKSFISILNRCNFKTIWIANQTPDYTYDGLVKEANSFYNVSITSSTYSDKKWTDEMVLPIFRETIMELEDKMFIGLHTIGSHWYYNYRYPNSFKEFLPVTQSRSIGHNSKDEIINSYDNSILFMDYFVNELISLISDRNSILIYISDHGELLGENQMWLHAAEHEVLYNSACFIWMSDKYKVLNPDKYKSAFRNKAKHYSSSLLFHSVLGACNVKTVILDEAQNVLSD